jgi:hypothetical protein
MNMMNDIKLIRLNSGEEILCTIIYQDDRLVRIEDPTIIIPTEDRNIALAPWMPYAQTQSMAIRSDFIAFTVDPHPQLAEQYRSIHSKIITPSTSIVT